MLYNLFLFLGDTRVEAPLVGEGKLLVGRELLKDLILVLDGPKKETCISERADQQ